MQNDFNDEYIKLLSEQVNAEIEFLVFHGHEEFPIQKPCMFCIQVRTSIYGCNRLKHLREFKSQIDTHTISRSRAVINRRQIGMELSPHEEPVEPFEAVMKEVPIFKLKW